MKKKKIFIILLAGAMLFLAAETYAQTIDKHLYIDNSHGISKGYIPAGMTTEQINTMRLRREYFTQNVNLTKKEKQKLKMEHDRQVESMETDSKKQKTSSEKL